MRKRLPPIPEIYSALLFNAAEQFYQNVLARVNHRDLAGFSRVPKMPMVAFCTHVVPAVRFDQLDYFSAVHHGFSLLLIST
jgi:hypothetical protein